MSQEAILTISNLSKQYKAAGRDALSKVSISVSKGSRFGIIGPNGAGKTTLISIVCGLIEASEGSFEYNYERTLSSLEKKKFIGYVPQDFSFYEELSPKQNFDFFGAMNGLSNSEIKDNSSQLAQILGLKEVFNKKVKDFSGGMKRRVNLAIGMLHKPEILFLDEPTVGVDVQSKYAIFNYLKKINEEGCSIIYTSHHLAEAEDFCTDLAIIDHGKLLVQGKTSDLVKEGTLEKLFIELTGEEFRDQA